MSKVWKLKPQIPKEQAHHYQNYDGLLAQLLYNRGLSDDGAISDFLNPQYERLHSPFLFQDMPKAVERIWQAIDSGEKICIYSDYDADAVTANAVLQQTFRYLDAEVESYIPDRFSEGYGVNLEALSKIIADGSTLIVTVDCGANAIEAAEFCQQHNIDLIITDHHEIIGEKPDAYALINPKNPADNYPDQNITGVGVAFKMACGLLADAGRVSEHRSNVGNGLKPFPTGQIHIPGWEKWLLDLVAIGTVADCHELLGENRILVKFGLKVLAKTRWLGLRALAISAGLLEDVLEDGLLGQPQKTVFLRQLDTYTLGFIIAPRLNAAGRLEHANAALRLLLETDAAEAQASAKILEELNRRRQDTTARILSEAREKALLLQDRKILVMMNQSWHKGVVGLVAGRLAEEFCKPTIVLQMEGAEATGSARSVGEFDIVAALKHSQAHLLRFGGHKQAAGLTLSSGNFEIFYQTILEFAERNISEADLFRVFELEAELSDHDLELETFNLITQMEPFGAGNPRPKFLISNMKILSSRQVGAAKQHSQMQLRKGERTIAAIAFNSGFLEKIFKVGDTVDAAAELIEDGWNGRRDVKLKIIDLRPIN